MIMMADVDSIMIVRDKIGLYMYNNCFRKLNGNMSAIFYEGIYKITICMEEVSQWLENNKRQYHV